MRPHRKARLAGGLIVLLSFVFFPSCAVNPATGQRQLSFMSEGQEIQMGREAHPDIVATFGVYPDESLQEYVTELGNELAASSERPDLPWTFTVLDDPLINAFALPGGFIYVTRGIMAYFESEAELAGVLGHEIGHVTARHSVNQISRAQLAQLGLGVGMILAPELQDFAGLASTSLQLLFLKFGRDDEREADRLGVRYMGRVGYDPNQLSGVMAMLGRVSSESGGGPPEWLSTHPDPENREEAIREMAQDAPVAADPALVRKEQYLRRLDGMVFGQNPREGYFEGTHFYHPDLAFQIDFPTGWQTRNSRQAVGAGSPDGDAVMGLTLAEGASPSAALRAFLSQEGIEAGFVSDRAINGVPAAAADFRVNTQDGVVQGRAVFLEHAGTLLRFLGYGSSAGWRGKGSSIQASLESFRPLADEAILAVQPARLRIVTLGSATDLSTILVSEGAEERADVVRTLNRLDGNPTLPSGTILKIPVGGMLPGSP
jgi:predicted Zn-dependent protease